MEQTPSEQNPQRYLVWMLVALIVTAGIAVPMYYYVVAKSPTSTVSIFDSGPQPCPSNDNSVCGFSPGTVTIPISGPLFWTNSGKLNHTVTSTGYPNTAGAPFDSGVIRPGDTYNFELTSRSGTYAYFCRIHPWMNGTVTVG